VDSEVARGEDEEHQEVEVVRLAVAAREVDSAVDVAVASSQEVAHEADSVVPQEVHLGVVVASVVEDRALSMSESTRHLKELGERAKWRSMAYGMITDWADV
jgi:hypothetical protein